MPPASDPAVVVRDLRLDYPVRLGGPPRLRGLVAGKARQEAAVVHALKGVSLSVPTGTVLGIIGANGAGKSSLLKVIAGIIRPTAGEVEVRGEVGTLLSLGATFVSSLTGRRNALLGVMAAGVDRTTAERLVPEVLAFADLGEFEDYPVQTYSSGMRGRLGFAIAACLAPDVLLVDEALSTGDAAFRAKCENRIHELVGGDSTALVVSHRTDALVDLADTVVWIDAGEVRMIGDPREVTAVYLATP